MILWYIPHRPFTSPSEQNKHSGITYTSDQCHVHQDRIRDMAAALVALHSVAAFDYTTHIKSKPCNLYKCYKCMEM